jgi:RNA 3'-phosphate cyclase
MIDVDGSYGEGGGQILRTALALSAVTGKPFRIKDIRKNRQKPGLKMQHLHCIKGLMLLCDAEAKGAELGSTEVEFKPGKIEARTISIDIGTAGSVTLVLQALLLPAIHAPGKVRLRIRGGTDVPHAMPVDYLIHVLLPALKEIANVECVKERRGYAPAGDGRIDLAIKGTGIGRIDIIDKGKLLGIEGISHAALPLEKNLVAERQARAAKPVGAKVAIEYADSACLGSGITLWAEYENVAIGASALGEKGKRAEAVGEEAIKKLNDEMQNTVDSHLADNLIPYLGIFGGRIKAEKLTLHSLSSIYVTELFTSTASVRENIISFPGLLRRGS